MIIAFDIEDVNPILNMSEIAVGPELTYFHIRVSPFVELNLWYKDHSIIRPYRNLDKVFSIPNNHFRCV